jgi:hypothetical protein
LSAGTKQWCPWQELFLSNAECLLVFGGGCDDGGAHFESISDEGTEECYSL